MASFLRANETHIDKLLTRYAQDFEQNHPYVSNQFTAPLPVQNASDLYKVYSQADKFRIENDERSPGSEPKQLITSVGSQRYEVKNYALMGELTVEDIENADPQSWPQLEQDLVRNLQDKLMLNRENRFLTQITNTANVGSSSNVASAWSDLANSSPYDDINTALDNVHDSTGYRPNQIIVGIDAHRQIARNNFIIDKTQKTGVTGGGMNATERQLAELFEVDKYMVSRYYKNTNASPFAFGAQALMTDFVHLSHTVPTAASQSIPTYYKFFRWTKGAIPNMGVKKLRYDDLRDVQKYSIGYYEDGKVTGSDLGFLISYTSSSQ